MNTQIVRPLPSRIAHCHSCPTCGCSWACGRIYSCSADREHSCPDCFGSWVEAKGLEIEREALPGWPLVLVTLLGVFLAVGLFFWVVTS